MAGHVYHWRHGWIPLDHVALKHGGHRSQAPGRRVKGDDAEHRTGIHSRRDVAKAASTIGKVPAGPERRAAAKHLRDRANELGHQDLLVPKTPSQRLADTARVNKARHVTPDELALFAGGSAEQHLIRDPDGSVRFTPQRQALHDRIIADTLAGNTPVANPAYNVMGGGPAAGKSTMEKRTPQLRDNAALINPDDIKAQLPEYATTTDGTAAVFTHEESSYLAKRAVAEAFNRRINVTLDGTGDSNIDSLKGKIKAARDAGYAVNGYYVTVDTDEAVRRANKRGERSGRFVPESVVRGTHENISRVLPQVTDQFDHLQVFDNNQAEIRLIAEKHKGDQLDVAEPALWQDFLAKAPEQRPAAPSSSARNFQDFRSMTSEQKIDAAAQMFGTGSKQHRQAQRTFGTKTPPAKTTAPAPPPKAGTAARNAPPPPAAAAPNGGYGSAAEQTYIAQRLAVLPEKRLRSQAKTTKDPRLKRAIAAELTRRGLRA